MKIKVVSWNIWQGNRLDEIISFLKDSNADIIGLQEVVERDGTNTAAIIANELGLQCVYYRSIDKTRLGVPQGNAILSKFSLLNSEVHYLSNVNIYKGTAETEPRIAVEVKIKIGFKTLYVLTTHLAYSPEFKSSETRNIQIDNLIRRLHSTNTILMGDFNSHPDSINISNINRILVNTDNDLSKPTWTIYPFEYEGFKEDSLRHRLDYIFVSKDIKVDAFLVEDSKGSDHLPVSAVLEI